MPIYEYRCLDCGREFEVLVRTSDTPACPSCQSQRLERTLSMFAAKSEATSQAALNKAKRRATDARRAEEREKAQYEHDDHDHH